MHWKISKERKQLSFAMTFDLVDRDDYEVVCLIIDRLDVVSKNKSFVLFHTELQRCIDQPNNKEAEG